MKPMPRAATDVFSDPFFHPLLKRNLLLRMLATVALSVCFAFVAHALTPRHHDITAKGGLTRERLSPSSAIRPGNDPILSLEADDSRSQSDLGLQDS